MASSVQAEDIIRGRNVPEMLKDIFKSLGDRLAMGGFNTEDSRGEWKVNKWEGVQGDNLRFGMTCAQAASDIGSNPAYLNLELTEIDLFELWIFDASYQGGRSIIANCWRRTNQKLPLD